VVKCIGEVKMAVEKSKVKKLTIEGLISQAKSYDANINGASLRAAYNFSKKIHSGQKRATGGAYLKHPLEVAFYLAGLKLDQDTLVAALLHDTLEDGDVKFEDLVKEFGEQAAWMVYGVTKLRGIKYYGEGREIENLRKMFLIMAKDIRVVLLRLADRYCNLKTIGVFSPEKRKRIARQTIEVYAPLAERLGMGELKGLLEDEAFKWLDQKEYNRVSKLVGREYKTRKDYISKVGEYFREMLDGVDVQVLSIDGRRKHLYSLYKKLQKNDNDINKIYDIVAFRIIVPRVKDCYHALGVIHQNCKPLVGRIKDYISVPKANGYQSLHTTVFCLEGKLLEVQIKTQKMHEQAEWGVATHWMYKEDFKKESFEKLDWVKKLQSWQEDLTSTAGFGEALKEDIFGDRIFIFTPKGDVVDLPEGATSVDFAFEIHSNVGLRCSGAKINEKISNLDTVLKNGDVVEIITRKNAKPSRDWLLFAKTTKAKNHIRNFLKEINKGQQLTDGRKILEAELKKFGISISGSRKYNLNNIAKKLKYQNLDALLVAIGEGHVLPSQIVKKVLVEAEPPKIRIKTPLIRRIIPGRAQILIAGEAGIKFQEAGCCKPNVGDPIVGFVTRGKGVKIHKVGCKNIGDSSRQVYAVWGRREKAIAQSVEVFGKNRRGLIGDIGHVCARLGANIAGLTSSRDAQDNSLVKFSVEIQNPKVLYDVFRALEKIKGVSLVKKG